MKNISRYLLGFVFGASLVLILGNNNFASASLPVAYSSSTLSGVYALVMGKLDFIKNQNNQIIDLCAKRR